MEIKYFVNSLKKGQTKYEPKRNLNTELKYFELLPWQIREAPGQPHLLLLAVARNSGDHYVAMRDTLAKKEYVEKVILTTAGEDIKVDPIQISDDLEWNSAMEFFVKMGVIQNTQSKWQKAWRKYK